MAANDHDFGTTQLRAHAFSPSVCAILSREGRAAVVRAETMRHLRADSPVKRKASRRWVRRSIVIAAWMAFAVTCLTACFAVTTLVVSIAQGIEGLAEIAVIAMAVIVLLASVILLMAHALWVQSPTGAAPFVLWLLELRRILEF
jgi:hypothetical protein